MANSATVPGNQQAPQFPGNPHCEEALAAAKAEADLAQGVSSKRRPRAASGLRSSDGQVVTGQSGMGNNGVVEDIARRHWEVESEMGNNCGCAELNAISNAMDQGIDVRGAVIITVEILGPNTLTPEVHGQPKEACPVCEKVLDELEIIECKGKE